MDAIAPGLPDDIRMQVIRDQSRFINGSLHEVAKHLILGAVLVTLTILLFIRDWRTTVIAAVSIPCSVVSTFLLMHLMGFTLNTISMLALVMAVGVVIDDAVVVHENIFRHMEEYGKSAWRASIDATREIALAVLATTFSLLVIFLPLAFMEGRTGKFFSVFGFVMAFSIAVSLMVSFTLTPMLCSRFLKLGGREQERHAAGLPPETKSGWGWRLVEIPYMWLLGFSLRHRWLVVGLTALMIAATVPLFQMLGKDFLPRDDQSEFEIVVTTPEGWTLDRTDRLFREIEAEVKEWPHVRNILVTIGDTTGRVGKGEGDVTQGSLYVRMDELDERREPFAWVRALGPAGDFLVEHVPELTSTTGLSQFELMRRARVFMKRYPELRSSVNVPNLTGGGLNADIQFNLLGPDLRKLEEYSETLMTRMRQVQGLVDVDTTLALRKPELRVLIDREKASDQNVDVETIAGTLSILVGGQIAGDYKDESLGERYDVWLRARAADRRDERAVWDMTVPAKDGRLVQLAGVVRLDESRGPSQIDRFNRQRKVTVYANAEGIDTNAAMGIIGRLADEMNMGKEYTVGFTGRAKLLQEAWWNFAMAFALSVVFMYMILAAQFESFSQPITILLAAPLSIPFAFLSLILMKQSLDVYATLGLFLLFGIVKKNGILQVDYTNILRGRGMERDPAILQANATRLRPILMTTVMLVAGMIPIALGTGPGSSRRASVAKVIVGGQAMSLVLSLLITPVAYSLFDDAQKLIRRLRGTSGGPAPGDGDDDEPAEPDRPHAPPPRAAPPPAPVAAAPPVPTAGE
jgi:HAE1 family hydrophobic/amphiphilic exporter-1